MLETGIGFLAVFAAALFVIGLTNRPGLRFLALLVGLLALAGGIFFLAVTAT